MDNRNEEELRASFLNQPLMPYIGAKLSKISPGQASIEVIYKKNITQQHGLFHGGVSGAIADNAAGFAAMTLMDKKKELMIANYVGGISPKEFSPPPFRYFNHLRIPSIKEAEMKHFKNFIKSTGGSWDLSQNKNNLKIANLADGKADPSIMNYVTEKGFFLDGQGKGYMQQGGKFYDAGEYNPDVHGLPVPLVKNRKKLKIGTA